MTFRLILIQLFVVFNCFLIECEINEKSINNDSKVLQELYHKFQINSKNNETEVKGITKLFEIINTIQQFKTQLSNNGNSSANPNTQLTIASFVINTILNVQTVVDISTIITPSLSGITSPLTCLACNAIMSIVFIKRISIDILVFAFSQVCGHLQWLGQYYYICEDFFKQYKSQIDYIRYNTVLDTTEICAVLVSDQCYYGHSAHVYWKVGLPEKSNNSLNEKMKENPKKMNKILHLTDIHLDLNYVPFSGLSCKTIYCCRQPNGEPPGNNSLNYWGSYPCDTPLQTMDNTFRNIDWKTIEWTYWTGDVNPHDIWLDNRHISVETSRAITSRFKIFSPNRLVVPAIGNHMPIPFFSFPPLLIHNSFHKSWLLNELTQEFVQWLPKESLKTFQFLGYFVLKKGPNFRIIVMNTDYCARLNIWTYYKSVDPADQLKWLVYQLDLAEKAGDYVHIVGHIPPDIKQCPQSWLYNFMAIVERYSDIIMGQLYGHTHYDEFRVYYSVNNSSKPIGFAIISPSLTTWQSLNPAYRILHCKQNGEIIDMITYAFDLAQANNNSVPNWYQEYSWSKTYSMKQFNAISFDGLLKALDSDDRLMQTYYSLYSRKSLLYNQICDKQCKSNVFAALKVVNPFQQNSENIQFSVNNAMNYENVFSNQSLD